MNRKFQTNNKRVMKYLVDNSMGAITLFSTVHYKHDKDHEDNTLERHLEEMWHVVQWQEFLMPIKYIYYNWKLGYKNNPYEIEAKNKAKDLMLRRQSYEHYEKNDDEYLAFQCERAGLKLR